MDEVIVGGATTGDIEHGCIVKLIPLHFLLPSHFHHLPVGVGMLGEHKSGAVRGSVLGHKPTRLEPNPTSITQRLGP